MSNTYEKLVQLKFTHDYYSDGLCPDLEMLPTSDTLKLLKGYRLLFGPKSKFSKSEYVVLQENVSGAPLLTLPDSYKMRFYLSLKSSDFLNFSDLPELLNKEVLFFENQAVGTDLHGASFEKMELTGDLVYWTGVSGGISEVTATLKGGTDTVTFDTYTEGSSLAVRLNLKGLEKGVYELFEDASLIATKTIYYDPELLGKDVFAVIHFTESVSLNIGANHTISFASRDETWRYFVVLKGTHTGYNYSIYDSNEPISLSFSEYTAAGYVLTTADLATESMLNELYGAEAAVEIYVSSSPLTYQEQARSLITLGRKKIIDIDFSALYKNLPNPAAGNPAAGVIIGVDPPILES